MRKYPDLENDYDKDDLIELNAENWQLELLKKNPGYVYWGNHEDYMYKDGNGWDSRVFIDSWEQFNWELDDLNEVVNFYFEVYRESKECNHCDRTGYNPETKQIADDYYDFAETGRKWCQNLTDDEIEALMKDRNLTKKEAIARMNSNGIGGCDSLDRYMLINVRAKRLGVYGHCKYCDGKGYIYTEDKAKVALQLWVLHPRKGCSRGVRIKEIKQNDISSVIEYLREAKERNLNKFSKL